jgi:tetratricopeptide (TPR) repeat protein
MFEKALKVAPEMTSPYLGLGLIAKCEGNNIKAEEYLRKALADNYSAVGFAAYKQAKAAQPPKSSGEPAKPLSPEKGDAGEVNVPEMPVYEQMERTASQEQQVQNYLNRIDSRMQRLLDEYNSTLAIVRKQQEKALKDPGNSMVFNRDFAMELMQFQDVSELLFGENSNYGKAITNGGKLLVQNSDFLQKDLPSIQLNLEKSIRLIERMTQLIGDMAACGDNEPCKSKVQEQINTVQYEMDQLEYQSCVLQKGEMENTFSATCKAYKAEYSAFKEAVLDYYAYTNPILEKIYSPSFNELQNLYREMLVLTHEKAVVGIGSGLPEMATQYNELKCVEPKPPDPPEAAPDDSKLPKKKEKDCPLGKDGIKMGIGALSFELGCDHVKLSGGEGLLWSVSRDFNKHETKIGVGVGAKGEYGNGNLSVEATVMVEVTIGQGDVIKNVELTSSVKAGLGGLVEGEVAGRVSLESGPELSSDAGFITPDIPGMGE